MGKSVVDGQRPARRDIRLCVRDDLQQRDRVVEAIALDDVHDDPRSAVVRHDERAPLLADLAHALGGIRLSAGGRDDVAG